MQHENLADVAAQMNICGECGNLFGTFIDAESGGVAQVQRCTCPSRRPPTPELRWGRRDFNTAVELCFCCAATLVPTGSRWSRFFCAPCYADVLAWNARSTSYIPVGRHSIANGIMLLPHQRGPVGPDGERPEPAWFAAKLTAFFARVGHLIAWRAVRVRQILGWTGCGESAPAYLAAAQSASGRREAFAALTEHFAGFTG
jgi:hypothetical protein